MGDKFNRNYTLLVQTQSLDTLTVQLPFTVEFDITRTILNSSNVAAIRIYNLSPQNREALGFNIFNQQSFRTIQLFAGYGNNLSTIFSGNITECWSVREGVNFITQIACYDGGFVYNNNTTSMSFPAGTTNAQIVMQLIANLMPTVKPGVIVPPLGTSSRGKSYSGPTTELLGQLTNGGFFIDNTYANVLPDPIALAGQLPVINDQSGLLGTPVREQNILTLDLMFEPRLAGGAYISLQLNPNTPEAKAYNGNYKINSVKHRGMISSSVCGDCITTVSMTTPAVKMVTL